MMQWWVVEGNRMWLDGGAMFGHAPKELWGKWITPNEKNQIPIATRCFLFQTENDKYVLFDASVGNYLEPKLRKRYAIEGDDNDLLRNLEALGVKESDIDAVVLSHLHFDHVGGILSPYEEGPLRLLFPNATYYVSAEHFARALTPHTRDAGSFIDELPQLLQDSGRLFLIEKEGPLPEYEEGFAVSMVEGHTPGLLILEALTKDGLLALVTDLVPGMHWIHLPIALGYDRFPEKTTEEKEAFYQRLLPQGALLGFAHDPAVAVARLQQDSSGRYYGTPFSLS